MTTPPGWKANPNAIAEDSSGWSAQIGPGATGQSDGYFYSSPANFYVSLGQGDPGTTYVWYKDPNNNWQQVPNNQQVTVSGSSGAVYFYYNVPAGVSFKFLMGPA